jgi:hypothetical protein
MAGLTSREGEAIKKALDLDVMSDLYHKVEWLERLIAQEVGMNADRVKEATRILDTKKTVDGKEIRAKGDLFKRMVRGLDESGLISALSAVKSVMLDLQAKRTDWLAEAEGNLDKAGFLARKGVDRKYYDAITMSS